MSDIKCDYCTRTFSRRGAFRNHLQTHRDQMYLEENKLTREEVAINSTTIRNTLQKTVPLILTDELIYNENPLDVIVNDNNNENVMNVDFYEVRNKKKITCI